MELHCPSCGYNLKGNTSDHCPECGTAAARAPLTARLDAAWQTCERNGRWSTRIVAGMSLVFHTVCFLGRPHGYKAEALILGTLWACILTFIWVAWHVGRDRAHCTSLWRTIGHGLPRGGPVPLLAGTLASLGVLIVGAVLLFLGLLLMGTTLWR